MQEEKWKRSPRFVKMFLMIATLQCGRVVSSSCTVVANEYRNQTVITEAGFRKLINYYFAITAKADRATMVYF